MKTLSRKRRIKQARQRIGKNWRDVMSYERFCAWAAKKCGCIDGPCGACLAGGICDAEGLYEFS